MNGILVTASRGTETVAQNMSWFKKVEASYDRGHVSGGTKKVECMSGRIVKAEDHMD